ncbi:PKD domain-containing protein, partial [candidate division WOR-3 bacterium]|nr:PKD domain-containing protein [candidate division WOR-3 bacterium]
MDRRGLVPLTIAVTAFASFLLVGCGSNHSPVIAGITYAPADSTVPGGAVNLKVTATDEDNDPLSYAWTATGGAFTNQVAESTVWTGPTAAGSYTLKVTVSDGAG